MQSGARVFGLAILLETGLGFVGVAIAYLADIPLKSQVVVTQSAVIRGLLATLPMLVALVVLKRSTWSPLVELRNLVESIVRELFSRSSWLELALICLAAGVGEELLFRGALQPFASRWIHPVAAVCLVSLLFGLAHAMSVTYFVTATAIGCYFGWLTIAYDDLVAPIVAHALYDFVALVYIQRKVRHGKAPHLNSSEDS